MATGYSNVPIVDVIVSKSRLTTFPKKLQAELEETNMLQHARKSLDLSSRFTLEHWLTTITGS